MQQKSLGKSQWSQRLLVSSWFDIKLDLSHIIDSTKFEGNGFFEIYRLLLSKGIITLQDYFKVGFAVGLRTVVNVENLIDLFNDVILKPLWIEVSIVLYKSCNRLDNRLDECNVAIGKPFWVFKVNVRLLLKQIRTISQKRLLWFFLNKLDARVWVNDRVQEVTSPYA